MILYVFGSFGESPGLYPEGPGWRMLSRKEANWLCKFADSPPPMDEQTEGMAWVRSFHGWTALGWFDRQGREKRGGAHTTILVRGAVDARVLLEEARRTVPWAIRVGIDLAGVCA